MTSAVAVRHQGAVQGVTKMLDRCRNAVTAETHNSPEAEVWTRLPLRRILTGPGRLGAEDGAPSMTRTREIVTRVVCEGCLLPVLISPMVRLLARVAVLQQALKR
jgi:hypothetical protein